MLYEEGTIKFLIKRTTLTIIKSFLLKNRFGLYYCDNMGEMVGAEIMAEGWGREKSLHLQKCIMEKKIISKQIWMGI